MRIKAGGVARLGAGLLALALVLAGCAQLGNQRPTIALVAPDTHLSDATRDGLRASARAANARLWVAPPPANLEDEAARVADALAQNPAALVIAPISPEGSLAALRKAKDAGVPVLCLETCVNEAGIAAGFLPGPNRDAGGLMGDLALEYIIDHLDGKAVILELPCSDSFGCGLRQAEFTSRFPQMPDVTVLETGPSPDEAQVRQILSEHPEVNLMWAGGMEETQAALSNINDLGLEGKIKLFGFGLDEKLAAHLGPEAPLYVTAAALDYQSGYDAGELALALSRGVAMPAEVRKAVRVFTGPGKDVDQYLKKPSAYMQPTLPALPDAGSGIKPSCNCQPEAHPVQPTAAP